MSAEGNGKRPFYKEAHQFKGVFGNTKLDIPSYVDPETAAKLRAPPPLTRDVSLHFSNGDHFDIQEDHQKGTQYLILPADEGSDLSRRQRVLIGDWIVQLQSGRYIKLTDQESKDMGVVESPFVPCPPYPGQEAKYDYTKGGRPYGAPPDWTWK